LLLIVETSAEGEGAAARVAESAELLRRADKSIERPVWLHGLEEPAARGSK
jgi:hypothetical protein